MFIILMSLFMSTFVGTAISFQLERAVFLREYANQLYGLTAYYIAKSMIDMPVLII